MIRGWLAAAGLALCLAMAAATPGRAAGEVAIEGNRFYRDGAPWVAEGVTLVGLVAPEGRVGRNRPNFAAARAAFGPGTLEAIRDYGADTIRYQVSQAGLDPKSTIHDPAYRDEVLAAIRAAREAGFTVIVSMQWQGPSGKKDPVGVPSDTTRRAWRAILPAIAEDRGILLEVFNEPAIRGDGPADWKRWTATTQPLVDMLRRTGSQNVLLVGGVLFAHSFEGAPELADPRGQLGYAIHPFLYRKNLTEASWDARFGSFAATHPVMATAFNAHGGSNYCGPDLAARTAALLEYLRARRIGLVVWAFDLPWVREGDGRYARFDDLVCAAARDGGRGGAGQMIHEYFLAH